MMFWPNRHVGKVGKLRDLGDESSVREDLEREVRVRPLRLEILANITVCSGPGLDAPSKCLDVGTIQWPKTNCGGHISLSWS